VEPDDADFDGARGHKVLPYGGGVKVRMVLVVLVLALLPYPAEPAVEVLAPRPVVG
jgi:hypothetical protein